MNKQFVLPFALLIVLLTGCEDGQSRILATEKVLPVNYDKIGFQRENTPLYTYVLEKVSEQNDFEKTWEMFQLATKRPEINFEENEILFLGVEESGSCPYKLTNKEISYQKQKLTIKLTGPDGPCTADATPRTFVIEMPKEKSKKLKEVKILQTGNETTVPLKSK